MENYFELYGMEPGFAPDATIVRKRFLELSREHHPDRFATADVATRNTALRLSALNNEAYKTLQDPDRTMAYMLKLSGILEEEEKYNLPPAFLMEMMDLNEVVDSIAAAPENVVPANNSLQEQLAQWEQEVRPLLQQYAQGQHDEGTLKKIKDYYFRKKYLLRIQERLATFTPH